MKDDYEFGPDAQLDRDYESLTDKQENVVDSIVRADPDTTYSQIANDAGVNDSYVHYVENNFPHIITDRNGLTQVAADGGDPMMTIELPASEVWKTMQMTTDEISQKIWRQTRSQ